jgi:hypothetical protein
MRCKACDSKLNTLHWDEAKQEHEAYCSECRSSVGLTYNKSELEDLGFTPVGAEFDELD